LTTSSLNLFIVHCFDVISQSTIKYEFLIKSLDNSESYMIFEPIFIIFHFTL